MTSRILPAAEYYRLPPEFRAMVSAAQPQDAQVVVVEEYSGAIVAHWAVLKIVHIEGCWIDPDYRKQPGVVRRLLVAMNAAARTWGVSRVVTAAIDDDVRKLLAKLGAERLDADHYVLPLKESVPCPSV